MREDIKQTISESFFIYARPKAGGTFKPLDLGTGEFVNRLFYATILKEEEVRRVLQKLAKENPAFEFEARNQKKTINLNTKWEL